LREIIKMKKLISGLCAGGLAATFALTSIPSAAAPAFAPPAASIRSDVVQIQDVRKWRKNKFQYNGSNQGNNWNGNNFRKSGNSAYYNGHKGYPYQRRGYRQHNGLWFPAAAFIAGAVIGGAIINNNDGGGSSHVEWCYDHYRSYRAYDNTFQPNYGRRRQCNSPFG
jgi:hypothetical protein